MLPEVGSTSRRMQRPRVLLPEPDSPTNPKVSPARMSNETPSTARTSPPLTLARRGSKTEPPKGKVLIRLRTSTRGTRQFQVSGFEFQVKRFVHNGKRPLVRFRITGFAVAEAVDVYE